MLKIKENNSEQTETIPMNKMKPLQVGVIKNTSYKGSVVIRTASNNIFEVMNLSESGEGKCWTGNCTISVELLPKGESITIELFN